MSPLHSRRENRALVPCGDEGTGCPERVTPEQWLSLVSQDLPCQCSRSGQGPSSPTAAAEQLTHLTPACVMSWDMQGWDQQRWEDHVSFCSITCAGGEVASGLWGDGKVELLLCSQEMPFSFNFSVQEKERSAGKAAGRPRHVPWSWIIPPHTG